MTGFGKGGENNNMWINSNKCTFKIITKTNSPKIKNNLFNILVDNMYKLFDNLNDKFLLYDIKLPIGLYSLY